MGRKSPPALRRSFRPCRTGESESAAVSNPIIHNARTEDDNGGTGELKLRRVKSGTAAAADNSPNERKGAGKEDGVGRPVKLLESQ